MDTTNPVLAGILERLETERQAKDRAERDIRDANDRYATADANVRALERLISLYEVYAANGDYSRSAARD